MFKKLSTRKLFTGFFIACFVLTLYLYSLLEDYLNNLASYTNIFYQKKYLQQYSNCSERPLNKPHVDVQMLELYNSMKFNEQLFLDGKWKTNRSRWSKNNKLKVFIVPHSHNDPGWLTTVDKYFYGSTRYILDNVVTKLKEDPKRKFIWAEISYFSKWWDSQSSRKKAEVKKIIDNGQLEFVTGGWVMNDEANTHWLSIVYQLTEGHQWLQKNLNYTPQNHWSIDPFGLSSTQAFLLKKSGFENMVIQRAHYAVKSILASTQSLEFEWKQLWDETDDTEIFTQLMPFNSYSIKSTCGPDPNVCFQFDFKYLSSSKFIVEKLWKKYPEEITDKNVAEKALLLLDQYQKKSMLFRTNVLLVPLGDDFRYSKKSEIDAQFRNYEKIMKFLNTNSDLDVEVRFGNLNDYFEAVRKEKDTRQFPSLTGDFFTYSDKDNHYWSGYYTSRPFYKSLERTLLSHLRTAEIMSTLALIHGHPNKEETIKLLGKARRSLALFQHHDAITGTSKDFVVQDYAQRMTRAVEDLQYAIQVSSAQLYLNRTVSKTLMCKGEFSLLNFSECYRVITLFNSLTFTRKETVSLVVNWPFLKVFDVNGKNVQCQVSPVFKKQHKPVISNTEYELTFLATIPALGLSQYSIYFIDKKDTTYTMYAKVKVYNYDSDVTSILGHIEVISYRHSFTIKNSQMEVTFNEFGLLKTIYTKNNVIPVQLDFGKYSTNWFWDKSGAYLFSPNGKATPISSGDTIIKVIEGPFMSSVEVQLPYVYHVAKLSKSFGTDSFGLNIDNFVNIVDTNNFELVMRLTTGIENYDQFFTDLNGFQVVKRKRFSKLPLQANYYPIPSMIYIEDDYHRLTLITRNPLGGSSLKDGQIEIMQDRRLNQDDHLGLGEGIKDNVVTHHSFKIILEERVSNCKPAVDTHPSGFPSARAFITYQILLNPLVQSLKVEGNLYQNLIFSNDFPIDYSLSIFRENINVKNENYIGITLHRVRLDKSYANNEILKFLKNESVNLQNLLSPNYVKYKLLKASSLTYLHQYEILNLKEDITLKPMEVKTFLFGPIQ